MGLKRKKLNVICLIILIFLVFVGTYFSFNIKYPYRSGDVNINLYDLKLNEEINVSSNKLDENVNPKLVRIHSTCKCHEDILVEEYMDKFYVFENRTRIIFFDSTPQFDNHSKSDVIDKLNTLRQLLNIKSLDNVHVNPRFTCDLYDELRYGPKQKVISYSLYGTDKGYYNLIEVIAQQAKKLFPKWVIRIYYDSTVMQDFICEMECKFDHISFCNVNKILYTNNNTINSFKQHDKANLSYVHGMMWRWFPISDDFVDFFSSRDTDSNLIQREKDSVEAWLQSNKLFHIMRDNPYHNIQILGGLWGHANVRSRISGYEIYHDIIDESTQSYYNGDGQNFKNSDQTFLLYYVWLKAKINSLTHDSYNCKRLGGEPFPSKRPTNMYCFVSCFDPCCDEKYNQTQQMDECPIECRPKDHQDWTYC